jgi:hypothetical protein
VLDELETTSLDDEKLILMLDVVVGLSDELVDVSVGVDVVDSTEVVVWVGVGVGVEVEVEVGVLVVVSVVGVGVGVEVETEVVVGSELEELDVSPLLSDPSRL